MKQRLIFGTCLSRSGGSLVSNLLTCHKNIFMTTDLFHLFRFAIDKYSPITNYSNQYKLVHDICLRLKIRNNIIINPNEIIKKKVKSYKDIMDSFATYIQKKNKDKKFIGEVANNEWRNIGRFLKMSEEHKAFQVIRDPRAILASWKKLTYSGGHKYLNIIFQWIDSINYSEQYLKKFPENYLRIKFEDIHINPKKNSKKFCNFLNLKMDNNMINVKKWPKLLKNKFIKINVSSYNSKKQVYGFSQKRNHTWKKNIENWEVALIQFILKKYLKKLKYNLIKTRKEDLAKGMKILSKDKLLKRNYKIFLNTGKGSNKFLHDPSNPKNWAANETESNFKRKFIDTKDYEKFIKNSKKIEKNYNILKRKEIKKVA